MDLDLSIVQLGERVKSAIREDPREGATALVLFANAHAVTARLKHEALVLKFNQRVASGAASADTERLMLELVERIERDHAVNAQSPELREREHALQIVRERFVEAASQVESVLIATGLRKRYPGAFELTGVDLRLRPGEITGVVGENGHGKTTLLRIAAGELRADGGTLEFPILSQSHGRDIDWVKVKPNVAYLPQELPSWRGALRDHLHFAAATHGIRGAENEREVEFFVERMGLREHLGKRWSELSSGTRLRFALAQVLIWKPKLLVLDEPLANLDVNAKARLLQDMEDLARSRQHPLAILMSSQDLHELENVSSTLIFLRKGKVEYNGPREAIGADRTYNLFEIGTPAGPKALAEALRGLQLTEPTYNGFSYVVKTPRSLSAQTLIEHLLRASVEVHYFRDVSRSIKRLFD